MNELSDDQGHYNGPYDEQFQELTLDSITIDRVKERGCAHVRNSHHHCSCNLNPSTQWLLKVSFFLADIDGPTLMGLPIGEALGIIKIMNMSRVKRKLSVNEHKISTQTPQSRFVGPSSPKQI